MENAVFVFILEAMPWLWPRKLSNNRYDCVLWTFSFRLLCPNEWASHGDDLRRICFVTETAFILMINWLKFAYTHFVCGQQFNVKPKHFPCAHLHNDTCINILKMAQENAFNQITRFVFRKWPIHQFIFDTNVSKEPHIKCMLYTYCSAK